MAYARKNDITSYGFPGGPRPVLLSVLGARLSYSPACRSVEPVGLGTEKQTGANKVYLKKQTDVVKH